MYTPHEYSLLELCQELHMNCTGASDTLSPEEFDAVVEELSKRLREWRPGQGCAYDLTVRLLVIQAVNEARESMRRVGR